MVCGVKIILCKILCANFSLTRGRLLNYNRVHLGLPPVYFAALEHKNAQRCEYTGVGFNRRYGGRRGPAPAVDERNGRSGSGWELYYSAGQLRLLCCLPGSESVCFGAAGRAHRAWSRPESRTKRWRAIHRDLFALAGPGLRSRLLRDWAKTWPLETE